MTPAKLDDLAQACVDWFWKFGRHRKGPYEVSAGTWLDAVCRIRDHAQAMERAGQHPKPCMALWGPSQTGKSTLLSGYLDAPDDPSGHRSALKWSDEEPIRFVVGADKTVLALNPYNQGSDASGCVSRFTLCDSVPDPEHPVDVLLASEAQIMHALAVGYESECQERNAKGEVTAWDAESLRGLLEKFRPAGPPLPEAYEKLHALAQTVDLLILSQHGDRGRYSNLAGQWEKVLRPMLLSASGLLSNVRAVRDFACEFFWDGWPSLSSLYDRLVAKREEVSRLWGDTPVRCSYRVATLLLDIDAYKHCDRYGVTDICFRSTDGAVPLGTGDGQPLFPSADDFGYFQGLVWELRIPLRRDVLVQRAPVLCDLLSTADLLDFPGVANAYGSAEKRTDSQIAGSLTIGLTEILKRGKTASIVVSRARSLDIDGFSLLMRVSRFPAQPKQLNTGIRSWLQAYGQPWPLQSKTLPLNLVLTFCAKLVNDVRQSGIRHGLAASFGQLQQLGSLTDPKAVTTFATTYSQFDEGRLQGDSAEQARAVKEIMSDAAFQTRFAENAQSFEEMARDGGTDYFFRHLKAQAQASRRPLLVAHRLQESQEQLLQLIREHLPSDSAPIEERRRILDTWRDAMLALLQTPSSDPQQPDTAAKLSRHLRRFLNIDPADLDDIPQKAIQTRVPIRAYLEKQFRDWKARQTSQGTFSEVGFLDATHAQKALGYLLEATDLAEVEEYFRADLGHIPSRSEARNARRFLAVKMSRELLNGRNGTSAGHPGFPEVRERLETMAQAEESQSATPEASPHYRAVIQPLLKRIEELKKTGVGARPPQPGDAEISALLPSA